MTRKDVPGRGERRRALRIAAITIVALAVFSQDIVGLIDGAGLWSLLSALRSVGAHSRIIEVDDAALRSTVTGATCVLLFAAFARLDLDIRRRWPAVLALVSMVAGSLVLDAMVDEPIVASLLAARGYRRCPAGDHVVGSGRARVWFDEFAAIPGGCPVASPVRPAGA